MQGKISFCLLVKMVVISICRPCRKPVKSDLQPRILILFVKNCHCRNFKQPLLVLHRVKTLPVWNNKHYHTSPLISQIAHKPIAKKLGIPQPKTTQPTKNNCTKVKNSDPRPQHKIALSGHAKQEKHFIGKVECE